MFQNNIFELKARILVISYNLLKKYSKVRLASIVTMP